MYTYVNMIYTLHLHSHLYLHLHLYLSICVCGELSEATKPAPQVRDFQGRSSEGLGPSSGLYGFLYGCICIYNI